MSGWINDPNHDLALVFGIGVAVASLYYAHSRKDYLDTNETLDEIHEDVHEIKDDIQKMKEVLWPKKDSHLDESSAFR